MSSKHPSPDGRPSPPLGPAGPSSRGPLVAALLLVLMAACTAAGSEQDALQRGDEAFARGDYTEALAEYRLVLRQSGGGNVDVLTRTAHAYAQVGRIAEARAHYAAAIDVDPEVADLAAADLLRVARNATERRRDAMLAAAAVEAALALRPGVNLRGLARPLAEHFADRGQYGQALPYYQKALGEGADDPALVLDMVQAYEELGDCELALTYLEGIQDDIGPERVSEVSWRVGNCSFDLGMEAVEDERLDEALELFGTTIELGEPQPRVAQAWFESGEILAEMGRCTEAVEAFEQAQRQEMGGGFLVQRARDRIDDIRWGSDGPC